MHHPNDPGSPPQGEPAHVAGLQPHAATRRGWRPAFVALGSNLGEPARTLERCATALDGLLPGVRVAARSRLWQTAPLGPPGQPWYANMVVRLECAPEVTARALFAALMGLEARLGRNRVMERRWGPRILDVDLLLFGSERSGDPAMTLPHPRMWERAFVLLPLREVAPELVPDERLEGLSFSQSGTIIF
ncbi:2-amino-4-hydroxy-6-hydroxymethyldihydropteridine diphosphokinase [Fundidesulfovibrio agrisoli]|uniref:2-amino-4-hydroxy-6- hydroxymethyldihydropteridine diphosphokinase n=1 Tax=Fundidesulfovibrio agrisoli TaxID=2922717 RepID=UPI001FACB7F5|nr:2-amino-4-hydroxy-6-hydroxymethyldihydropteridine diphosphokinase [Fundidesulfovibrio agrisoli]